MKFVYIGGIGSSRGVGSTKDDKLLGCDMGGNKIQDANKNPEKNEGLRL